jgi:hypothetical protein
MRRVGSYFDSVTDRIHRLSWLLEYETGCRAVEPKGLFGRERLRAF